MSWLGLALACLAGALSPGPSLLFVLAVRGRDGSMAAVAAALGHGLGVGLYAAAAATGLALVIQTYPALELGLSLLGAAYLLWLAYGFWPRKDSADYLPSAPPRSARSGFVSGMLVALLNPKVVLFFAGIFAAMVPAGAGALEVICAAALAAAIDAAWYSVIALLGARLAQRMSQPAWARGFSVFFAAAAGLVLLRSMLAL
nr:LysE family transporter [Oceanococcus sp. HetDA_MAG_MS8]